MSTSTSDPLHVYRGKQMLLGLNCRWRGVRVYSQSFRWTDFRDVHMDDDLDAGRPLNVSRQGLELYSLCITVNVSEQK
jgi:hypothetical protein